MKLNEQQTTYIENYIKRFDIKYYEVYMEILDHMILSVEAILEKDKEISFEDAVVKAKVEGFGEKGFRGMMNEKVQILNKIYRKKYGILIKDYFKFPLIVLTFVIFISFFVVTNLFKTNPRIILFPVFIIVFYVLIDWLKVIYKFGKKKKLTVLKTSSLGFYSNNVFLWLYFFNGLNYVLIEINYIVYSFFCSVLFTMCFISFLIYYKIKKHTVLELQTQIFV
ncbi:hypothetical protein [Flavobacterium sp.]|uniref:hypothetical protein n=1 Tax=Flavobacterium sp. TaxID=239 RepID=UPI003F6A3613